MGRDNLGWTRGVRGLRSVGSCSVTTSHFSDYLHGGSEESQVSVSTFMGILLVTLNLTSWSLKSGYFHLYKRTSEVF